MAWVLLVSAPAAAEPPPAPAVSLPGSPLRLRLEDGRVLEGTLVTETREGWVLRLGTGETRFLARSAATPLVAPPPPEKGPAWAKAVLWTSLLWPGAGQLVWGAWQQKGWAWERSALAPGVALAAGAALGAGMLLGGALLGWLWPQPGVHGAVNPVSVAGLVVLGVAWAVSAVDVAVRVGTPPPG